MGKAGGRAVKAGGRAVAVRAEDAALAEVAVEAGEAGISPFAPTI